MELSEAIQHIGEEEDTGPVELTDWPNPPTVEDLQNDLSDCESDHDSNTARIDGWLDNLNITSEAATEKGKPKTKSSINPKLIRKQAEWRYAALSEPFLASPDIFNVDPVTFEDKAGAVQNQLVLNNQFNTKLNKVKFIDDYVRTAVDEGTVIMRVGWETETEEELVTMMTPTGEMIQVVQPKVIKNQPTIDICDYNNVYVDPTCEGDLDKAGFVIYQYESSLSDLKKAGIYYNLDYIDSSLGNTSELEGEDHASTEGLEGTSFEFSDKPRKKLVVNEYWGFRDIDGSGETTAFVGTWVGETMIRLQENPYPDKKVPFVLVQYLPVRREIYGEPDGALIEDNQKVVGAVTRGMIDIMARSANGQVGYKKGALDVTNKRKFDAGKDYEFNPTDDPRNTFYTHTYPEIPNSAMGMLQIQQQEAESITGVRPYATTQSEATATQSRNALDAATKRENGILRRLSEGMKQLGRKIIAMNAKFLSEEEFIRVTNEQFVPVRRDDLAGNFDLRLSISTVEADNEKAQELSFMLQTLGNNVPFDFTKKLLAEIANLRKMPELAKDLMAYEPPPPTPEQQQMQQLELQKLMLENQILQTQILENQADAGLTQAKTGTEYAKQGVTKADMDKKNLDFIEQQSGVEHARNVDKITSQAESQAKLKIVEAQLNAMAERNKPQNQS